MGESGELHSEENKVFQEKNKKRKIKTPSQVEALEKFYNEHKYPSESMKFELAEQIGLTEKQVSGWFCHRRLKDKRLLQEEAYGNGKQDRSSGVIQDHGSGLRQDSCGSTKQGDYRLLEHREVESWSFHGEEDLMPTDLNYEQNRHYVGELSITDDSSSETSSPLQDRLLPESENPCDMEATNYLAQSTMPINAQGVQGRGHIRPSGYLKMKGDVENAAITAVKRQLGGHYRRDGPPLGVEFQPLPPGAFDMHVMDQVIAESYHAENPILPHSSNFPGIYEQPDLSMRNEGLHPKMTSLDYCMEGDIKVMDGPDPWDDYPSHKSNQKSSLPNFSNPFASRNYSKGRNEDSTGETSTYRSSRKYQMRSKHGAEAYNGKEPIEQTEPWLDNYDNSPKRVCFDSEPSNMIVGHRKFLDMEEREPSRRMAKAEKLYGERKAMKECHNSVGAKLHSTSEMRLDKRARDAFPRQDYYAMKAPYVDMHLQKNQIKGSVSAVDMPSCFSEDETAETSSSMD